MIPLALALVSANGLAAEIILMRIFSIVEWQQFAWMIISLALLGFGASGTLLTILRGPILRHHRTVAVSLPGLAGAALWFSLALSLRIEWRSLELLWNPYQSLNLLAIYLVLAVPFAFTGMFIGLSFMRWPGSIARLYGADLAGAAAGAILAIALLQTTAPDNAWTVLTTLDIVAGLIVAISLDKRLATIPLAIGAVVAAAVSFLPITIEPGEYKAVSQALRLPGAEIISTSSGPLGAVQLLRNEEVPLRFAPGLSLNYFESLPPQRGIFIDGEGPIVLNETSGPLVHLDATTFGVVLRLIERPETVFIAGLNGIPQLVRLVQKDVREIDLAESNAQLIDLVSSLSGWGGDVLSSRNVSILDGDPRSSLARLGKAIDLIVIPFTPAENRIEPVSLVTVESFELMIDRLDDEGLIAVTTPIETPPRTLPRLLASIATALEAEGLDPSVHTAAIRAWDAATIIVSRSPLGDRDVDAVRAFSEQSSFDLVWLPGMTRSEANRFNRLDRAWQYEAAREILRDRSSRKQFIERYKFTLSPPTDDRPWFGTAMKWETLIELLSLRDEGGTALVRNGYPVLLVAMVQAVIAGALLVLLPIFVIGRRRPTGQSIPHWRVITTFGSLGLAFLFIEIIYLYRLSALLGRPLESTTLVLATFLLFSGLGSMASHQSSEGRSSSPFRTLQISCIAVCAFILLELPLLIRGGEWMAGLSHPLRALSCVIAIAPLAFLMGFPFPTALAIIRRTGSEWWIAWAWAINGCASVISAILATLLTIHLGLTAISIAAATLYLVAGFTLATIRSRPWSTAAECVEES